MGYVSQPQPVKLVLPMLAREPALFLEACECLSSAYGRIDYSSVILPFDHTTYYEKEFGCGLQRQFVSFERLVDPGQLAEIKLQTNSLEQKLAVAGRRIINLDPGYLTLAKFVLATTKDQGHRIYIGQGIYAEITLIYQRGEWRVCPWTYPDYQSPAYLLVISELRDIYINQLREYTVPR
ncbi:MAG: DUF4416 family protein [Anaerolineae bacterium]